MRPGIVFHMGAFFSNLEANGGIFGQFGANVYVEFSNVFLIGGIFSNGGNWGQMGTNVLVESKFFYNWGQFEPTGANVYEEFEKKI